jgi:hypothetical protein
MVSLEISGKAGASVRAFCIVSRLMLSTMLRSQLRRNGESSPSGLGAAGVAGAEARRWWLGTVD